MTTNIEKLLKNLSESEELSKKFAQLEVPALIAAAKELGIDLTKEDFASAEGEVSENELESIAGGSSCKCFIAGGGSKTDGEDAVCGCVAYGEGSTADNSPCVNFRDVIRCQCIHSGEGDTLHDLVTDSHSPGHRNH